MMPTHKQNKRVCIQPETGKDIPTHGYMHFSGGEGFLSLNKELLQAQGSNWARLRKGNSSHHS